MAKEPQSQPQHVSAGNLSESVERLRQGLDALDALLAEAEEAAKALIRKPSRKKTASDHSDT